MTSHCQSERMGRNAAGIRRAAGRIGVALGIALYPSLCFPLDHPHLFFSQSDIPTLQDRRNRDFYRQPWDEILQDVRSTYPYGWPVDSENPNYRYGQAIMSHAAVDLFSPTDSKAYHCAEMFLEHFWAVMEYPQWATYFGSDISDPDWISCSQFLTALAVGYDWRHEGFSATERAYIVEKLAERADFLAGQIDIPLLDGQWGYLNYFRVLENKFVFLFSGLGVAAYCLEGEVDEARRQVWLDKLDQALAAWASQASPDGVSHEAYNYHEYALQAMVIMLEARARKTGVNQVNLYPYLQQHPFYSIYSWVPGGDRAYALCLPFGDSTPFVPADMRTTAAYAAARLAPGPDRGAELANWMQWRPYPGGDELANNNYARDDPLHYFWADENVPMASPTDLNLPAFHYFPHRKLFVWRSGWDHMATYFAMICGPQIGGHQQPELGNFVICKGGAPYIAHHGDDYYRMTQEHNVMMINGLGQYNEEGTDMQQRESRWGMVDLVLADNKFFDVLANPAPIYREDGLQNYTREYVGFADYYFVRDKAATAADSLFENYLHAYKTTPPKLDEFTALDIYSDPLGNPWSGGGGEWTISPRDSGPYTGPMTVVDLSRQAWEGEVSPSMLARWRDTQHGYKLLRSIHGASVTSLMGFGFLPSGDQLRRLSEPGAEGFRIVDVSGRVRAACLWPSSDAPEEAAGLRVQGAMGGVQTQKGWYWGRDQLSLSYGGCPRFQSDAPVSYFAYMEDASGNFARVHSAASTSVAFHHPAAVGTVVLNGGALSTQEWVQDGEMLTIFDLPAQPDGGLIQTFPPEPPRLESAKEAGPGTVQLTWSTPGGDPAMFLGFAWDIYLGQWVERGYDNTLWFSFPPTARSGLLDLGFSGACHAWISSLYPNSVWLPAPNPWTGVVYEGTPHMPVDVFAEELPGGAGPEGFPIRLQWRPDLFGAWRHELIAYDATEGRYVETGGPDGEALWHFTPFPTESFLNGTADLVLPAAGDYWLFIRGVGWTPPYPAGEFAKAFVSVGP